MEKIKILAKGNSTQEKSQKRGALFEKLMANVLREMGYSIEEPCNVNYAGMEIDIVGKQNLTNVPIYAECKCYEKEIDCPKLQTFMGKYFPKWFENKKSIGLFIAIPGINSHAKGYVAENISSNNDITVEVLNEDDVLKAIFSGKLCIDPHEAVKHISNEQGSPGDWVIAYTEKGFFVVCFYIRPNENIPKSVVIFDSNGKIIQDATIIDYLKSVWEELDDFDVFKEEKEEFDKDSLAQEDIEEIVEVKGGSSWLDYQFPASPNFFVGRQNVIGVIDDFVCDVLNKKPRRGELFLMRILAGEKAR